MPRSFGGRLFIPPKRQCPAVQKGTIEDIRTVDFDLAVDPDPKDGFTNVYGVFSKFDGEEVKEYIETDTLELPAGSDMLRRLYQVLLRQEEDGSFMVNAAENTFVEKVRDGFYEGIADCPGLVGAAEDECGALGATAVQRVLEAVLFEYPEAT